MSAILGLLGIDDTWIWMAYLLVVLSAVLCIVFALILWNKGDEEVGEEDVTWAKEEQKVEEEL